jgi:hypothetical protein
MPGRKNIKELKSLMRIAMLKSGVSVKQLSFILARSPSNISMKLSGWVPFHDHEIGKIEPYFERPVSELTCCRMSRGKTRVFAKLTTDAGLKS